LPPTGLDVAPPFVILTLTSPESELPSSF
jgi:hypothetical protein